MAACLGAANDISPIYISATSDRCLHNQLERWYIRFGCISSVAVPTAMIERGRFIGAGVLPGLHIYWNKVIYQQIQYRQTVQANWPHGFVSQTPSFSCQKFVYYF